MQQDEWMGVTIALAGTQDYSTATMMTQYNKYEEE